MNSFQSGQSLPTPNPRIPKALPLPARRTDVSELNPPSDDLASAVRKGEADKVKTLLGQGAQPSQSPNALNMAAYHGNTEIVELLLNHGTQPSQLPDALTWAAARGHTNTVELLLTRGAQPSQSPDALKLATTNKHTNVVKILLANGAQPNLSPGILEPPVSNGRIDIVRLLLDNGAQPEESPMAIKLANCLGHTDIAQLLQNHGEQPSQSQGALTSAACEERTDITTTRLQKTRIDEARPVQMMKFEDELLKAMETECRLTNTPNILENNTPDKSGSRQPNYLKPVHNPEPLKSPAQTHTRGRQTQPLELNHGEQPSQSQGALTSAACEQCNDKTITLLWKAEAIKARLMNEVKHASKTTNIPNILENHTSDQSGSRQPNYLKPVHNPEPLKSPAQTDIRGRQTQPLDDNGQPLKAEIELSPSMMKPNQFNPLTL